MYDDATEQQDRTPVTAAAVRDAALSLFAQRGYHGTALSQIAERLHVRTPSLYNHMTSKQDLLREIVTDTTRRVWTDFEDAVSGYDDVRTCLHRAVSVYALRHATHQRAAIIVNREIRSLEEPARSQVLDLRRRHEQAIRGLITTGVEQGVFTVESPFLASFGMLEMCVSIAHWYRTTGPLTAEQIADEYGTFALRMVSTQP